MIEKIVSGGQSGADRAALDWAISRAIPHGGWCTKGRLAEDGTIPAHYALREMASKDYLKRTEQNVIDSDGTVIFSMKAVLSGGSKRTAGFAAKHGRPLLHIHAADPNASTKLATFVAQNEIKTLNVAGPRASNELKIAEFVMKVLNQAFPRTN